MERDYNVGAVIEGVLPRSSEYVERIISAPHWKLAYAEVLSVSLHIELGSKVYTT
jgi:hypothetical protein